MKLINRILTIIFILSLCSVVYSFSVVIALKVRFCNYKYIEEAPDFNLVKYEQFDAQYSKTEAKAELDKIFKAKLFFYTENENNKYYGRTYAVFRVIAMNKNISINDFIFYYAHELVHLTEFTENDIYANFKAFKVLYESGNETFKKVAMNNLYRDMNGVDTEQYTYWHYAKQYLLTK